MKTTKPPADAPNMKLVLPDEPEVTPPQEVDDRKQIIELPPEKTQEEINAEAKKLQEDMSAYMKGALKGLRTKYGKAVNAVVVCMEGVIPLSTEEGVVVPCLVTDVPQHPPEMAASTIQRMLLQGAATMTNVMTQNTMVLYQQLGALRQQNLESAIKSK